MRSRDPYESLMLAAVHLACEQYAHKRACILVRTLREARHLMWRDSSVVATREQ